MAFTTRLTILNKIKNGEGVAWEEFNETYRKLIFLRASDRGLMESEKEDLLQNVMLSLFKYDSVLHYDATKGRFRDYLKKIIDRQAFSLIRKRKKEVSFQTIIEDVSISSEDYNKAEQSWDEEWREHLLTEAMEIARAEVSPVTYNIFFLLTRENKTPEEVSAELNVSMESVYVAKHRFIKRLKPIFKSLEDKL